MATFLVFIRLHHVIPRKVHVKLFEVKFGKTKKPLRTNYVQKAVIWQT
jgi:hypothetical protein